MSGGQQNKDEEVGLPSSSTLRVVLAKLQSHSAE